MAHLANTLEIYDYLLQQGAHVNIANAMHHLTHFWPTVLSVEPLVQCLVCLSSVCPSVRL